MRAVAIAIALVVATSAWADGDVPGAGPKARIAGNVLVWHDAQLVFDPAQPKQTVQAATLKNGRRASVGVVAAMKVIGVRGELVEVEPSADYECTHSTFATRELTGTRLFVAKADLAPVIAKRFVKAFDDGTRIELEPGMPVVPTETDGLYVVPLAFEMLRVEIPAEHVGYSYAAAPREQPNAPAVAPGTKRFRMYMDVQATLGGKPFKTRKDLFTPIVGAIETKGNVSLFPIDDRCGRAKVALPSDKIETFSEPEPVTGGIGGGIGTLGGGAGEYLPAKTPMFAGKQRVGTLAAERAPIKGTKCLDVYMSFDQPFLSGLRSTAQSAKVQLCAAPSTKLAKREGFGFGRIDEIAPLPALKDAKLAGHVLVSAEAHWFTDSSMAAKAVQFGDPNQVSKRNVVDFVFAAKVIGAVGSLVEVEVLKSSDCAPARIDTELATVRLFVERRSLVPVLAKPFRKNFKNGSRITLSPGVGVSPSIDGYTITINGAHATVPIPGASVAYSYTPVNVKPIPRDDGVKVRYSLDKSALLGDHAFSTTQTATRIIERGANVLFPLAAPCIDALVVAPKDAVSSNKLGMGSAGAGVVAGKPIQERWYIAKGTPLLSAKGRAVAKAADDIDVPKPADGAKEVCHDTELRVTEVTNIPKLAVSSVAERTLTLCVPVEQVKHDNPAPPRP